MTAGNPVVVVTGGRIVSISSEAVAWLASLAAKSMTGQSVCVNAEVTLH